MNIVLKYLCGVCLLNNTSPVRSHGTGMLPVARCRILSRVAMHASKAPRNTMLDSGVCVCMCVCTDAFLCIQNICSSIQEKL